MVTRSSGWPPVTKRPRRTLPRPTEWSGSGGAEESLADRLHAARVAALLGRPHLSTSRTSEVSLELSALIEKTAGLYVGAIKEQTRKTYARRWSLFTAWCDARSLQPLPASPETVMLYLADAVDGAEGAALSTLRGWLAAINRVHVEAGLNPPGDDPGMTMYLRTLRRVVALRTAATPISALRVGDLRTVCRALDGVTSDPVEVRDRALLALHRDGVGDGEVARLQWTDVTISERTVDLLLRSPRADRADRTVRLRAHRNRQTCPVHAMSAWRALAGTQVAWVFTLTDANGGRTAKEWDSRAIRRIRLARLDSLGHDGQPADVSAAMTLLGGRPSLVLRDKAMLLIGFAGAFRRPDLAGLRWCDLRPAEEGLIVRLRTSKTDPEGHGADVGIPRGSSPLTCPVTALDAWRARYEQQAGTRNLGDRSCFPTVGRAGRIGEHPMTAEAITRMVRRRVEQVALAGRWGGRSLRAGFISTAADMDIPLEAIARQSRHTTLDSLVLYIRTEDPFRRNPAAHLGL